MIWCMQLFTTMVATCSHSNHVVRKYVLVHTAVDSTSAVSVAPPRQYEPNTLNISVDKHQCKKLPVRRNNLWAHLEARVKIMYMCFFGLLFICKLLPCVYWQRLNTVRLYQWNYKFLKLYFVYRLVCILTVLFNYIMKTVKVVNMLCFSRNDNSYSKPCNLIYMFLTLKFLIILIRHI